MTIILHEGSFNSDQLELPFLIGLLKTITKSYQGRFAFVKANGEEAIVSLVRLIRAKCFRAGTSPSPWLASQLNQLDPPRCRCGKKGTRIIGSITFCAKCGPSVAVQQRRRRYTAALEMQQASYEQLHKELDYRDLNPRTRAMRNLAIVTGKA